MSFSLRTNVPAHISLRMRKVRRANTAAELLMQNALFKAGILFVTHAPVFGCTPDILIERYRIAIFVDGDFWHGRIALESGRKALKKSVRNTPGTFWFDKILRNIDRDARQTRKLRRNGWSVIRLWASDIIKDAETAASSVSCRVRAKRRLMSKTRASAA